MAGDPAKQDAARRHQRRVPVDHPRPLFLKIPHRWSPTPGETITTSEKETAALGSILASGAMTVGKFGVGLSTGSLGLLSEGLHSLLDLGAMVMTWFAVRVSDKPADAGRPFRARSRWASNVGSCFGRSAGREGYGCSLTCPMPPSRPPLSSASPLLSFLGR
ncbi:cation transporter [Azospirillum melinis]